MEAHHVTVAGLKLTTVDEPGGVDAFGVEWRCFSNEGWSGASGTTLSPIQKTRGPGAWLSPTWPVPRTLAPGGLLVAPDRASARAAVDRLNAAVATAGALYEVVEAEDELARWCTTYQTDAVIANYETDVMVSWSAQMVAVDPRRFSTPLTASTGLPSSSGGLTIPFTIPFTIDAVTVTGRCSLTNPGIVTGPVVLRIEQTGPDPLVGPAVVHESSGRALVFQSSLSLAAGEWIDVDMEAQTVLANGTASRNAFVVRREWSGFDPGVNEWSFAAVSGTGLLTVTATPAS